MRRFMTALAIATIGVLLLNTSADAGGFRLFRGRRYQQPQTYYYNQPSTPAANSAARPGYQSFSYEPSQVAVPQAAPQASGSGSHYQGTYRVQQGSSVPNMFRADRKILGLQSN